ncbi:MAG: hypothetical protein ACRDC6_20000 [Shewanella sp.]
MQRVKITQRMISVMASIFLNGPLTTREVSKRAAHLFPTVNAVKMSFRRMVRLGLLRQVKFDNGYNVAYTLTDELVEAIKSSEADGYTGRDACWRAAASLRKMEKVQEAL